MNFEKKLIIMSGANNAKGTVSLETNAYGTFVSVNVYNIPDLSSSEYALGIKNSGGTFTRDMGSLGRIVSRFKAPDMPLGDTHCVLYDSATFSAVMYGTNAREKLWEANLMDGIRREKNEKTKTYEDKSPKKTEGALPVYSARQGIEDYFLDILPKDQYYDNAIAEVNYYDGAALSQQKKPITALDVSNIYSGEKASPSRAPDENALEAAATVNNQELPYIYEMRYLYRHRVENTAFSPQIGGESGDNPVADSGDTAKVTQKNSAADSGDMAKATQKKPVADSGDMAKATQKNLAAEKPSEKNMRTFSIQESENKVIPRASMYSVENAVREKRSAVSFYEQVEKQIAELFDKGERFEALEKIMPNTKWVKIMYDNSGKFYVVGLIGAKPDYICYGVPAKYSPLPPEELDGYCNWLPQDNNPTGEGFWLMYQDATTGESVLTPG